MKSKLVIFLFAFISTYVFFNRDQQDHNQLTSDKCGYYLYLPATFIYHDLKNFTFYDSIQAKYQTSFGLTQLSNNNKLDKYTIGVAIFEYPFFIIADTYCRLTGFKEDGFSLPYQLAILFSNVFWVVVGLFMIRSFLKEYFTDGVIAITLLSISLGTNLYVYSVFDIGMSHPYSFFLFACLLHVTSRLYNKAYLNRSQLFHFIAIGFVLGLIFVARPVNIIAVIIPLFWKVTGADSLKERLFCFIRYYKQIIVSVFCFVIPLIVQFCYWHYVTGHWLYYSYTGEHFNFLNPHVIDGLFSYRKGWFVYTPMAIICFIGFYFLRRREKILLPVIVLFFIIFIYCIFCWQQWWYGGGFGCRPLIETFPFLSLPLTAMIAAFTGKIKIKKVAFFSLLGLIIALNLFQSYQYNMGVIHWGA